LSLARLKYKSDYFARLAHTKTVLVIIISHFSWLYFTVLSKTEVGVNWVFNIDIQSQP